MGFTRSGCGIHGTFFVLDIALLMVSLESDYLLFFLGLWGKKVHWVAVFILV
ncbi:hypothetical protein K440DRAFT_615222 [Wilcoxina mikolae CBS 423.85]|nr:hypothetical protein K440DRAFT_615222 [Wilcoxina mikolae CBS 423.85]